MVRLLGKAHIVSYPLAESAAWCGAAIAGVMALPQAARVRQRGGAGVSLMAWQSLFWAAAGWLVYGIIESRPQLILCNALMIVTVLITMQRLRRSGGQTAAATWSWPIAAIACGLGSWALWGELGFLAVMVVPSLLAPVAQLVRIATAESTSGLSLMTVALSATAQALLCYYGLATDSVSLVWTNAAAVSVAAMIVAVALWKRALPLASHDS